MNYANGLLKFIMYSTYSVVVCHHWIFDRWMHVWRALNQYAYFISTVVERITADENPEVLMNEPKQQNFFKATKYTLIAALINEIFKKSSFIRPPYSGFG